MEDVYADRDFPPFNRVMMDGIAIDSHEWEKGRREYTIEGIQTAGSPQAVLSDSKNCLEVMTGAMLPQGTDVVIRYEDVTVEGKKALIDLEEIKVLQNIHLKGTDRKAGDVLMSKSQVLSPAEIAVLATVGKSKVKVAKHLRIAIVSTGDELVDIEDTPNPYQIRKSNVYALGAALADLRHKTNIFHIKDEKQVLTSELKVILAEHDVVILSGGVSKGKKDYVPEVLSSLGVEKYFHGVKQRPGKPFWFGKHNSGTAVFALPGNPVSTFMCFYKYVVAYLNASYGKKGKQAKAKLAAPFSFAPELSYFLQVKVVYAGGELQAEPVVGRGSGDLANLLEADAFLELPPDRAQFEAGEVFPLYTYR
ncbi:Molybdopterin biosynthesis protein MoeA [Fulvivirga imtechensis AK7]|uniref:Molybdopterin molybdenumtransferase n=2 Tax=Fulvivirga TaxID=396811 RepID=L8JM62_9BACT|nr:Molybdopterin biosynthesis protein MoeA [Fulvivirga imtechensis AK7]